MRIGLSDGPLAAFNRISLVLALVVTAFSEPLVASTGEPPEITEQHEAAGVTDAPSASRETADGTLRVRFHDSVTDAHFGTVSVAGLATPELEALERVLPDPATWKRVLAVYTAPSIEAAAGLPPVIGRYRIDGASIRFAPRFAFRSDLAYTARFDGPAFAALTGRTTSIPTLRVTFRMPEAAHRAATRVEAIYPTAGELPQNLLRIYVHFSAPMRARDVHRHVRLYDGLGFEVPLPFVEIPQGLWDPGGRRLTLFFHPGRVKRGVGPNLALGPPLREGETFRLVVDGEFPDALGEPLAEGFEKSFRVGPPDHRSPNPDDWMIARPPSETDPLVVSFPEPLDHALLARMIAVTDSGGNPVPGRIEISEQERRWAFTPATPWKSDRFTLSVDVALEDLAGNRLDGLFETPTPNASGDATGATPVTTARPRRIVAEFSLPN